MFIGYQLLEQHLLYFINILGDRISCYTTINMGREALLVICG